MFDKEKKEMRPIEYRDITVLMRSLPSAPVYLDIFKHEGIPAYSDRDEGYFRRIEVQVMLALLRIIDNPYQDIPLAAVLRSPIVGLQENELAEIRLAAVGEPFYEAVKKTITNEPRLRLSHRRPLTLKKSVKPIGGSENLCYSMSIFNSGVRGPNIPP
ncbi:ATP-dependent nuclease, subunit A [Geomicrobium sp. JCM 19037]|nr:ATP-dependent nuclease, subunit A [Geomicrobium sp. JCM 19037]